MIFSLKSLFQASRPFFDDLSLADLGIHDCSAEFGNPSAHSIMASLSALVALWYVQDHFKEYF